MELPGSLAMLPDVPSLLREAPVSEEAGLVQREAKALTRAVAQGAVPVAGGLGAMWVASIVNWVVFGGGLAGYAITPLTMDGLLGILVAPFLHGDLGHLVMNSLGFVMLAPLTMLRKRMDFWVVTIGGALSSGLLTWLLGGVGTVHLGASGVLFAYMGFLMARGFFQRSIPTLVFSAAMIWFFGSTLWGLFPILAGVGISWQGHLGGFLGGVFLARALGNALREKDAPKQIR